MKGGMKGERGAQDRTSTCTRRHPSTQRSMNSNHVQKTAGKVSVYVLPSLSLVGVVEVSRPGEGFFLLTPFPGLTGVF